jgi:catechol 2,3-dioxygenase-like lactoylglutathione lyase family enzyme
MIKIRGFAHSALRVTDADRSISFYENVLGLKRSSSRPNFGFGGAWMEVGNNQIHLISAEKREGVINPLGPHVALDVEDFDETKRALTEMGIEFLEAPSNMAGRQLWILDPDGNTVELRAAG